jgi:hypothetical protein
MLREGTQKSIFIYTERRDIEAIERNGEAGPDVERGPFFNSSPHTNTHTQINILDHYLSSLFTDAPVGGSQRLPHG